MKLVSTIAIVGLSLFINEQYLHLSINSINHKLKIAVHNLNYKLNYKDEGKLLTYQDLMCFNEMQLLKRS